MGVYYLAWQAIFFLLKILASHLKSASNGYNGFHLHDEYFWADIPEPVRLRQFHILFSEWEDEDSSQVDVHVPKIVSLKSLENGEYDLIYAHPECLLRNKTIGDILRSKVYQERVGAVVIDEVHMVSEWGSSFRTSFDNLDQLICLFPTVVHLAMTATATTKLIADLERKLQLKNPVVVKLNPDRINIYLEVKTKLPNIQKYEKLDSLIKPISERLLADRLLFPLTIVYINNLEVIGYAYKYTEYVMGETQYEPIDSPAVENRLFGQYHAASPESIKQQIVTQLRSSTQPKLRLVYATVALGMGIDSPNIQEIIHLQPPTSLENYFQEIGRAGRSGKPSKATLFYNNNDIAKNRKDFCPSMGDYCKNTESCLRLQLMQHFGYNEVLYSGPPERCCSNCKNNAKV